MPLTGLAPDASALKDGDLLAAVDLGSNSFHMVVARYLLGQLRIVDRLRETVRMAAGLDGEGGLAPDALERSLACLARFGERIRTMPPHRVRAIATNSVRAMRNPQSFLVPAETALGHGIEIVSGREEARLIYLGVAQGLPPKNKQRLVIDIGGGSTEFIIGHGFEPLERESLQMGCVASTRRFFPDGKLSRKRWKEGVTEVSAEFQQFAATYRERGWQETIGSSGTIRAVGQIVAGMKLVRGAITDTALEKARDALLAFEHVDAIALPGLSEDRRPVIAGGLLILEACFKELGLKRMQVCDTAMREGVLHDMLGRAQQRDPRDASLAALAQRYGVDLEHAARVEATALALFDQVAESWGLDGDEERMLGWAARIHEIGLVIAHSQHHVHGAYLLEHSDIAGFSRQEQQLLAALVRCQRRSISASTIGSLPERLAQPALRLVVLLRLAALLHRSHDREPLPPLALAVGDKSAQLRIPRGWLDGHALTRSDLDTEREYLDDVGIRFTVRAA
ncbi:MAG: exopolyphosphatase [Chiayiivirga sp.]|jgi:exopolyphosphatase/guanosine-5'-triphosphate,3'-diphosphate pyrophosphatase|uniref:exopolyphosphatase n=1 Tax=Chiayiivirga sp. TaxID=2041042 RepID=UPI0025B831F7|nr:exopolyphosphatase [Chiayiivirga sp.]MCI1710181.1 exopolyphosphatase [Chiayiivirga sp.]MCI1729020.1 exopolyphosphatase [Chiayiivirga sp.]